VLCAALYTERKSLTLSVLDTEELGDGQGGTGVGVRSMEAELRFKGVESLGEGLSEVREG